MWGDLCTVEIAYVSTLWFSVHQIAPPLPLTADGNSLIPLHSSMNVAPTSL